MTSVVRRLAFAIAILFLLAGTAEAQSDSVLTRVLTDSTSLLGRLYSDSSRLPLQRRAIGPIRLASATGGFMFGMLLGGYTGHELEARNCINCRDRTTDALLKGAAIGGALGAALGAAFLDLQSVCTFDRRIVRTLAGSGAGAAAFFLAAGGLDKDGRSAFFIPLGAVGGALGSFGRCWKSRY
jgi:hypothetical protein